MVGRLKELTHNAMTKILSVEVWISLLMTAASVGVAYAYLESGVETNRKQIQELKETVSEQAESTDTDLGTVQSDVTDIKEIVAGLAATQKIKLQSDNRRSQRVDSELKAIRSILEDRR